MEPRSSPDGPPPPYSETDIYSHSPGPRNRHSNVPDDDASIAPSSSHSNIIFTPPESPRDTQDSFTGPSGGQHTTASAQDYFDSRPPNRRPGPNLTIVLEVTPSSVPSDFPYARFRIDGRDVSEQDWQTFINYLIPGHAARTNSHIIDRKLRDAGDAQTSGSNAIAEAQSVSLKSSPSEPEIDTVTREWNRGFFEPRGITIRTAAPADPAVEDAQTPEYEVPRENTADAEQSQSQPQQPSSWWTNPFGFLDGHNGSLRLGPLHIEGDRVALGSTFEADRNGVRWCGPPNTNQQFEANSRGVYWGDQHGPPVHPHPFMHRGRHPWPGPFGGPFGGRGRGRGGRDFGPWHGRRDHSRSSTSSLSSSSSSDSDSSIGSLPDWDDLKDTQLPVTKRSVQAWLSHPDQPVTKDMIKQAKSEIKAAKNVPPVPHDPSWDQARETLRREVKELLQQFKALKRQQRAAKRAARKERRQQKRAARQDRHERRHADRQERRAHENESRRADRTTRRAERDADRHARRHRHTHPIPPRGPASTAPPAPPGFPSALAGLLGRGPAGPHGPPFGFGRGFGPHRGRGFGRGWGPPPHGAAEQASHIAAEAASAAEREVEAAMALAEQQREQAFAQAQRERERAAQIAENSHRAAMQAVQRTRNDAETARDNAWFAAADLRRAVAEDSRRVEREAVSRAAVDSKLAEMRALESQIAGKLAQIQALEQMRTHDRRAENEKEKERAGSGKGADSRVIEQLEGEMELLEQRFEALRFEADEELARRLAEREDEWGEWK